MERYLISSQNSNFDDCHKITIMEMAYTLITPKATASAVATVEEEERKKTP